MTTSNQPGGPGGRGRPSRPGRQLGHGPPWRAWFARDASGDRALRGSDTVVSLRIRNRESLTDDGQQLQVALELVSTRISGSYHAITSKRSFERFEKSLASLLANDAPVAAFAARSDRDAQASQILIELFRSDLFGSIRSRIVCDSQLVAGVTESLSTQFEVGETQLRRFSRSLHEGFRYPGNLAILRGSGLCLAPGFESPFD